MRTIRFETLDSTSAEAARRAAAGKRGPVWIVAAGQTAGRGRSGRDWASARGNLLATLLMPVADDAARAALHSFVACLAVADTVAALAPDAAVALKWPNDVLLDGRKVAGVLLESGQGDGGRWLSVGIGLNLAHAPTGTRWPATSIAGTTGGAPPDPDATLAHLQNAMAIRLDLFERRGFDAIRADWLARAARLGEAVEARLPAETVTGTFETLDATGAMLLQTGTGRRAIHAGDVHFPGGA